LIEEQDAKPSTADGGGVGLRNTGSIYVPDEGLLTAVDEYGMQKSKHDEVGVEVDGMAPSATVVEDGMPTLITLDDSERLVEQNLTNHDFVQTVEGDESRPNITAVEEMSTGQVDEYMESYKQNEDNFGRVTEKPLECKVDETVPSQGAAEIKCGGAEMKGLQHICLSEEGKARRWALRMFDEHVAIFEEDVFRKSKT